MSKKVLGGIAAVVSTVVAAGTIGLIQKTKKKKEENDPNKKMDENVQVEEK